MVYKTEEQQEMFKFIIVLIVVILLILGIFLLSKVLIKDKVSDLSYTDGSVSTTAIIVGTMLNRPESEYYVLAYDTTSSDASSYVTYASYYKSKATNPIKIYYLNLNSVFNQNYYVESNSNPKAKKISDLKITNGTLIHVKNGKITEYIEGIDAISSKLKVA